MRHTYAASMVLPILGIAALAGVGAEDGAGDPWRLSLWPTLWLAGIQGTMTVRDTTAHFEAPYADLKDDVDLAFMSLIEVRQKARGVYLMPFYMKLDSSESIANNATARIEANLLIVEAGYYHNIYRDAGKRPLVIDVIGGIRYWNSDTTLSISGDLGTMSRAKTIELIDPIVGVRSDVPLAGRLVGLARADVGGFGLSEGQSDLCWSMSALVGYVFSERFTLYAGYRALGLRQTKNEGEPDEKAINVTMPGPQLSLRMEW